MGRETPWTPGPYAVDENGLAAYGDNGPNFYIVPEGGSRYDGDIIATLPLHHRLMDEGETPRYLEAKATAALLAAAPDLYEALVEAERTLAVLVDVAEDIKLEGAPMIAERLASVRAALARAGSPK